MGLLNNRMIFNIGASVYDVLTRQDLWRNQIHQMLHFVEEPQDALRILDLGCGPGISTFVLAEALGDTASIQGIDIADAMISKARQHHDRSYAHLQNIQFAVEDAMSLPYPDHSFDLAVGHSFLYLVPDPLRVLKEVHRVLTPNGMAVFMEPRRAGGLLQAFRHTRGHTHALWRQPNSTLRFLTSMVAWRVVSSIQGQLMPEFVEDVFKKAGFAEIACHPTLGGLGMHCVGRPNSTLPNVDDTDVQ